LYFVFSNVCDCLFFFGLNLCHHGLVLLQQWLFFVIVMTGEFFISRHRIDAQGYLTISFLAPKLVNCFEVHSAVSLPLSVTVKNSYHTLA